jgi:hypothetical protein
MKLIAAVMTALALLGCGSEARAVPITFSFGGSVTSTNFDPDDPFAGTIGFGSAISGSYSFESTSVDAAAGPQTGSYWSFGPSALMLVNIAGNTFNTGGLLNIGVANDFAGPVDQYTVLSAIGTASIEVFLQNIGGTAFASDALPLVAPNLASFPIRNFSLIDSDWLGNQIEIMGNINSLFCSAGCAASPPGPGPVPPPHSVAEPAGLASVLLGLMGVIAFRRRAQSTALAACALLASGAAHAVDGVVLIDQNKAIAGNVTPGDAPGYPVTISQPGSYRLSGNLTVPNENTSGISVTAGNVTIDMNGFAILGPVVCSGQPLACSPFGIGIGIGNMGSNAHHIAVRNGAVQGMGWGIALDNDGHVIEKVRASGNRNYGIGILAGVVIHSSATSNGSEGIRVTAAGTVSHNNVRFNGTNGIFVGEGMVSHNTANNNGNFGIATSSALLSHNNASFNGAHGLSLLQSGGYFGNVLVGNNGGAQQIAGGVSMGHNVCNGPTC